ncbi:MAG TPA: lysylphosphatidylglycerol synthase transmembrane domain-containing protein [Actinomycetota bacterium]
MRKSLKVLARVVVGGVVIGILVARTDLAELGRHLRAADVGPIAFAAVLFLVGLGVSALRWREYLVALEYPMPYVTLYRLYFVGTFFNAFLPTGVGGDAYKAIRIGRAHGQTALAFSSVFLDRFAGMVGLALIGFVMSAARLIGGDRSWVPALALAASGGIGVAAALVLGPGERLLGRGRLIPQTGIGGKVRQMIAGVNRAGRHPRAAAAGFALGVAFQGIVLIYHATVARGLGIEVSIAAMASIVVLASVTVLVPISVSGLGVVEFVYAHALQVYGVPHAKAVAFALVIRAVSLLSSAAGGLVYLAFGGEVAPSSDTPVD